MSESFFKKFLPLACGWPSYDVSYCVLNHLNCDAKRQEWQVKLIKHLLFSPGLVFLGGIFFEKSSDFQTPKNHKKEIFPPITTGCTKMYQWFNQNVYERGMLRPTEPIFGQSKCREWILIDSSAKNEHFRFRIKRKWNIPVPLFEWLAYWFLFWPEFTGQCFFRMDCSQFLC